MRISRFFLTTLSGFSFSFGASASLPEVVTVNAPELESAELQAKCYKYNELIIGCLAESTRTGKVQSLELPKEIKEYLEENEIPNTELNVAAWTEVVE